MEDNNNLETQIIENEPTDNGVANEPNPNEELETLKAQNLKLQQDFEKMKKAFNKSSSEASEYKKKWKSTQTEAEQRAIEKEEEDKQIREELNKLKRENEINKQAKNYLGLGYSAEDATKFSEALYDGNTEEMLRIQAKVMAEKELAIKSNAQKSMSNPPSGNGEKTITKEQFQKMNWKEKQELFSKDRETYNKLKS